MNDFISKMERKYGKRAIPHLTAIMIALMVAGYLMQFINSQALSVFMLDPYKILHGQIWRIVTWVLVPPTQFDIFTIIMVFFYFSIGTALEKAWGDFRYNIYIFGGLLFSLAAAFISYAIFCIFYPAQSVGMAIGVFFSTYYTCMSILLAFAATFPDSVVLLMFVIPVKMKYFGIIYGAFMIYDAVSYLRLAAAQGSLYIIPVIAMVASIANFVVFFFSTRNKFRMSPEQRKRQKEFRRQVLEADSRNQASQKARAAGQQEGPATVTNIGARHRCEVCGRTEISDPDLEFRFCSKCSGAHEYCMEHLNTHQHIKAEGGSNPFEAENKNS